MPRCLNRLGRLEISESHVDDFPGGYDCFFRGFIRARRKVGVLVQVVGLVGLVIGWKLPRRGVSKSETGSHGPLGGKQGALPSYRSHCGECSGASRYAVGQK